MMLHHLGVPCISKVREVDETLFQDDIVFYLNPLAIVRYEPSGAIVTPPMLYSSFLYIDKQLAQLLKKHQFNARGLPIHTLSLLLENQVLLSNKPSASDFREMEVKIDGLPIQVLLDVTSQCQCDCITCYHKADMGSYAPPLRTLLGRIKKLKELGLCLFEITGGEPLLRGDLSELLGYIAGIGLDFYIVTNGEHLKDIDQNLVNVLKKGLGVAVSIDGIGEVHDRLRNRPGLYAKVIQGLDFAKENGLRVYLVATLNEENIDCVPEMISIAQRYETTLHIRPTVQAGNAVVNKIKRIDLSKRLSQYLKHDNVRNGLISTKKDIPESRFYGCGIRKRISVSSHGKLFPCVMDRNRPSIDIHSCDQPALVHILAEETKNFLSKCDLCLACKINSKQSDPVCGGFCRFSWSYRKSIL